MSVEREVQLSELDTNMTIVSYTGFHRAYRQLDAKTCKWLIHNFKGCQVKIRRSGRAAKIAPERLRVGDEVLEIGDFLDSAKRLTAVNKSLMEALKKRGFFKFVVKIKSKSASPRKVGRKRNGDDIRQLVESIEKNAEIRDAASEAAEAFMDKARGGTVSAKEIKKYIDEMVKQCSPDAISAIACLKQSDQTYAHCVDVCAIYSSVYAKITERKGGKFLFRDHKEMAFAGFVHDLGKASVPKHILESRLSFAPGSAEINALRSHPEQGMKLLKEMDQPDYILNMCYCHHVKTNPDTASSYPRISSSVTILRETRLLSIVDVYQALIGKRPYKNSWAPPAAIRYLDALAGPEQDSDVWKDFRQAIGEYPVGSLVELNDGSVAFVMSVPQDDLTKPQVVVVQNGSGEFTKRHVLLDLETERDAAIVKEIDAQVHFGNEAMQVFQNIRLH